MKRILYFFCFFATFIFLKAQDKLATNSITKNYNTSVIKANKIKFKTIEFKDSHLVQAYIKKNNISKEKARKIFKINENGVPITFKTHSKKQIDATKTNLITNNAVSGFNLTGNGITAHVFDDGGIFTKHKEFDYRISNYTNNLTVSKQHPTWVAGVMAAKGLNADVKGMASKLRIIGDTFNGELVSRINEVATSGVLLSNHSYGYNAGWSLDYDDDIWYWFGGANATKDYQFGYYGDFDSDIDGIIHSAPYHLMVMSSGNSNDTEKGGEWPGLEVNYIDNEDGNIYDTTLRPRDKNCQSGFDCISQGSIAKNVLTIGAVSPQSLVPENPSSIKLDYFSSVGPTDDGRIKPDLVGVGSEVFTSSPESTTSYATVAGTSFSSPSVAGIAALLQEKYLAVTASYMRSDLVKSLLINTTNDAGNTGPDYKFGWGLVNSYEAAMLVKNNKTTSFLDQFTLNQAGNCAMEFKAAVGTKVKISLAWVDKEFNPVQPITYTDNSNPAIPIRIIDTSNLIDNRTKTLVNDLDLRVYQKNNPSQIYFPWKLDVNNPNNLATKADNIIDNVEKIEFLADNPTGEYVVEVKHKGTLVGAVNYSLAMNVKPETFCKVEEIKNDFLAKFVNGSRFYVKFPNINQNSSYNLTIFDITGKLVKKTVEKEYVLDIGKFSLTKGRYIGIFESNGQKIKVNFIAN